MHPGAKMNHIFDVPVGGNFEKMEYSCIGHKFCVIVMQKFYPGDRRLTAEIDWCLLLQKNKTKIARLRDKSTRILGVTKKLKSEKAEMAATNIYITTWTTSDHHWNDLKTATMR